MSDPPLPKNWYTMKNKNGVPYYFKLNGTGKTQRNRPVAVNTLEKEKPLPEGWYTMKNKNGVPYYFKLNGTGKTQRNRPALINSTLNKINNLTEKLKKASKSKGKPRGKAAGINPLVSKLFALSVALSGYLQDYSLVNTGKMPLQEQYGKPTAIPAPTPRPTFTPAPRPTFTPTPTPRPRPTPIPPSSKVNVLKGQRPKRDPGPGAKLPEWSSRIKPEAETEAGSYSEMEDRAQEIFDKAKEVSDKIIIPPHVAPFRPIFGGRDWDAAVLARAKAIIQKREADKKVDEAKDLLARVRAIPILKDTLEEKEKLLNKKKGDLKKKSGNDSLRKDVLRLKGETLQLHGDILKTEKNLNSFSK
jgi:hypothetical protein